MDAKVRAGHTARCGAKHVRSPIYIGITVALTLGYLLLIVGDLPGTTATQGEFAVALSESTTPELRVTRVEVNILQGRGNDMLENESGGHLILAWRSPVRVKGMAYFAVPPNMAFGNLALQSSDGQRIWYQLPGADADLAQEDLSGVVYGAKEDRSNKVAGIPVDSPAGDWKLVLYFKGDMSRFQTNQGWGKQKIFLAASTLKDQAFGAFPDRPILSVKDKWANDSLKISISYTESKENTIIQEPVPDAAFVNPHRMEWEASPARDKVSVQASAVNERTRFFMTRFSDVLLLLLGALLGILVVPHIGKGAGSWAQG